MDYKSADYFIYEQLVQLENAVLPLNLDEMLAEEIKRHKDKIVNKNYRVAVVGEFKRGKSSLINALLGNEILPADITPTTATVNRITYGIKPKITVNYKDGHDEIIGMNELSDYVTKRTKEGELRARTIKETVIEYPTSICRNYVDIIDTPGLNDNEEMTAVTLTLLKNIDAAIVTISAKSPFSGLEKNYICDMIMNNDIYDMVFAVTFIDAFTDDETRRLVSYISNSLQQDVFVELKKRKAGFSSMKKAHRILDNPKICGVSSYYALEADKNHDAQMREKSGIDAFTTMINNAFNSGQSRSIRDGAVDFIEKSAEYIEELHKKRLAESENEEVYFNELSALFADSACEYEAAINKEFSDIIEKIKEKSREIYALKNETARFFVKSISSNVHENTNEEIREVVESAYAMQEEIVNTWVKDNLVSDITALLNDAAIRMVKDYKESFENELKRITHESPSVRKVIMSIFDMTFNETTDEKENDSFLSLCESLGKSEEIIFAFEQKAYLQEDLTERNIIDDILNSIDVSFSNLIRTIDETVSAIKAIWYEKARTHFLRLNDTDESIGCGRIFATDAAKKEYIIRYDSCAEIINKVINNIQSFKE